MKISRPLATHLMQRALRHDQDALLALIDEKGAIHYARDGQEWLDQCHRHPHSIRVYNQHPLALQAVESLPGEDGEIRLEIFQDTQGVFGLRGWQQQGKLQQPVTLEFEEDPAD